MPTRDDVKVSGLYLMGMARELKRDGTFDAVCARVSEPVKTALQRPESQKWWTGSIQHELLEKGFCKTPEQLNAMSAAMITRSFGVVVGNVVKLAVLLTRSGPESVFSRMQEMVGLGVRGISVGWEQTSPTAGIVTATYPVAWPPDAMHLWRGTLSFVFSHLKVPTGQVRGLSRSDDGCVFTLEVSW